VLSVPNEAVRSVADGEEVIRLLGLPSLPDDGRVTLAAGVESTGSERRADEAANTAGIDSTRREPGVVFVLGADGLITPREIVTGVRDWEVAEVLDGLKEGEELVLLPSTSLLRSQQSMRERFARRNAMIPGAGR
jgi:hypothetical protein